MPAVHLAASAGLMRVQTAQDQSAAGAAGAPLCGEAGWDAGREAGFEGGRDGG